jgi:hypothetical protein
MAIANITNNILTDSGVATSSLLTTSAAASTYLALAGGTLTGALGGTSASFVNGVNMATTSGNVGIGTVSPSEKLDVIGGAVAAGNGTIRTGITYSTLGLIGTFTNHDLGIITNSTTRLTIASTGAATFSSSVTATGSIQTNSNLFVTNGSLNFGGTATYFSTDPAIYRVAGNDLVIAIGSSERFRIASAGAVTCTSSVTATSFFESSDSRLKTLIQDNYQTKGIASITPKLYTKNGKVELGYYAQDFVGVLDSAVSKGIDEMLSLSYREVLVAKVYALEQRIKELETK